MRPYELAEPIAAVAAGDRVDADPMRDPLAAARRMRSGRAERLAAAAAQGAPRGAGARRLVDAALQDVATGDAEAFETGFRARAMAAHMRWARPHRQVRQPCDETPEPAAAAFGADQDLAAPSGACAAPRAPAPTHARAPAPRPAAATAAAAAPRRPCFEGLDAGALDDDAMRWRRQRLSDRAEAWSRAPVDGDGAPRDGARLWIARLLGAED
ncbi:MAG: hypothetical protein AAFR16_04700 [Pseudomonadota bacterium]